MKPLKPVIVSHLFPELLDHLIGLLRDLEIADWGKPTICSPWSVKDVCAHMLGVEIGNLSWRRDKFSGFEEIESFESIVQLVNDHNARWVKSARNMSPQLLIDLIKFTGEQGNLHFQAMDPNELSVPVDWVGPDPAPNWLDIAREYTERWHHQQHIRDAVGKPGLKDARFLAPILDTFILGVPRTFESIRPKEEQAIQISTTGSVIKNWVLSAQTGGWKLFEGLSENVQANIAIPDDVAWRVFTKGIPLEEARDKVHFSGNLELGTKVLDTISIIG